MDEQSEITLAENIKVMIQERFGLDIPVFVILYEELKDLLCKAPAWWGRDDKAVYDNLIFVLHSTVAETIAEKIGEPTKGIEQICIAMEQNGQVRICIVQHLKISDDF